MTLRVGLVGFFGWGNYGDELMRSIWEKQLPFDTRVVHDLLDKPYFSKQAREMIADYDAILIGGGDLIIPRQVSPLYWNTALVNRPCLVSGIGAGLEDSIVRTHVDAHVINFLNHPRVDRVSVRDDGTASWIKDHGGPENVLITPDLGFAYPLDTHPLIPRDANCGCGSVGIVVRKKLSSDMAPAVDRVLRWAKDRGSSVEFLVAATGREAFDEAATVQKQWPDLPVRTESSIQGVTDALSDYTVVASGKFHVSLMCLRMGIANLTLRGTHKIEQLAQQVQDSGLSTVIQPQHSDDAIEDLAYRPVPKDRVTHLERGAVAEIAAVHDCLTEIASQR